MKIYNIKLLLIAIGFALSLSSCKKEADNIFNMFSDVEVIYHGNSPFNVLDTDIKQINEGDSVYIDYTITSAKEDMFAVCVFKNGDARPVLQTTIPDGASKRSYSGDYKFRAEKAGKATYRIYALNNQTIYMGDGYKNVVVDVKPNFVFYANRKVYAPDTTTRIAPSFYSLSKDRAFSYTDGKANSADIDFGIWRKPPPVNTARRDYIYNLYSLSIPSASNPLTVYDINDWTKRGTKFSQPQTSKTSFFNTTLTSGLIIRTEAMKSANNPTLFATTTELATGSMVYFITPEGKYGAIHVNERTEELDKRPYISISIKMEK